MFDTCYTESDLAFTVHESPLSGVLSYYCQPTGTEQVLEQPGTPTSGIGWLNKNTGKHRVYVTNVSTSLGDFKFHFKTVQYVAGGK